MPRSPGSAPPGPPNDAAQTLSQTEEALRESESSARQAEAEEETAYAEEHSARHELESLQQLHQGDVVQAVTRANETLTAAQHNQDRAARDLRQAEERLNRSESAVAAARHSLDAEHTSSVTRLAELRDRAATALGALPDPLRLAWERLIADATDQSLADALHAAWTAADGELAALEAHVKRIEAAAATTTSARQHERDSHAQHEAAQRAVQSARQALWTRWDKMVQRWPAGVGSAPGAEPSTMALPPLVDMSQKEYDGAHAEVREASARAARHEVRIAELDTRLQAIEAEINQTQTEPRPALSPERERAFAHLTDYDRALAYRHLDLAREGSPWGEAIEGLLEHSDALTLLVSSIPIDTARNQLTNEVDWHVLVSGANRRQAAEELARLRPHHRAARPAQVSRRRLRLRDPRAGAAAQRRLPLPRWPLPPRRHHRHRPQGQALRVADRRRAPPGRRRRPPRRAHPRAQRSPPRARIRARDAARRARQRLAGRAARPQPQRARPHARRD